MKTPSASQNARPRFTLFQILEGIEGMAIIIACYLTIFLKPLRDRWGLSREEAKRSLPCDEIIAFPKTQFTHATEINAPAEFVWPWMAQLGQGRGGFYSYEALENIIGLNIYNSNIVLADFQYPKVGDMIPFSDNDALPLVYCEHGKGMAIENCLDLNTKMTYDPELSLPKNYLHLTWLWYVEPLGKNRSRFISRNRVTFNSSFKTNLMFGPFMEPIVFAMDRKMCLGIKKRAEDLFRKKGS